MIADDGETIFSSVKNPLAFLPPSADRDTAIGSVIDKYLKKEIDLPDQAIHLLFTANRWETM